MPKKSDPFPEADLIPAKECGFNRFWIQNTTVLVWYLISTGTCYVYYLSHETKLLLLFSHTVEL